MITFGKAHEYLGDEEQIDTNRHKKLEALRNRVKENLAKSYESSKKRYDLRSRTINYVENEIVWRKNFAQSDASKGFAAKLSPKYIRCRIKNKIGTTSYQLVDMTGKDLGVFSVQDLKKS